MGVLEKLEIKRVGVFRALQLGDLICSIPAIRAFKKMLPDAELTLIGLPWAKDFVKRFSHYFSSFIPFPGYPGLPEQNWDTLAFADFLQTIHQQNFDLIVQMHGNGTLINPMIELLGAKYTAGFYSENAYCPDKKLFMTYPDYMPEIKRHIALMKFLGAQNFSYDLEFPVSDEEKEMFVILKSHYSLESKKYVCIHAGGRDSRKWWGGKNFATIADSIAEKGYKIVLTGTEIENENVREVEQAMKYPVINLVGKTDLGTLALLLKNSRMLFSNDTGVSHLAAAVKTPSVIVFLFSDPARWAPLNRTIHDIVLPEKTKDLEFIKDKVMMMLQNTEEESFIKNNLEIKFGR